MTLTIVHMELPDGQWLAKCDLFAAWKRLSDELDQPGAERSLKGHVSRRMQFTHYGWNGRTHE